MGRLHSAHTNLSCVPPADPDGRDHSSAGGSCGTGVRTYRVRIAFSRSALSVPGLAPRVFVLDDGAVYQTYSAGAHGVEFLMAYYAILDRAPKGRDEDDGFQLWIRRHDEYDSQ